MNINAAWETSEDDLCRCRWFVAWENFGENEIAGAVAGYSGGGSYVVERFYGKLENEEFTALWIDMTDTVSGDEIEFEECGESAERISDSALQTIWEWNDNDQWCDADCVTLIEDKRGELKASEDMLFLPLNSAPFVREVCEGAGLTAGPVN
jgi:hypothetical protein